MGKRSEDSLEIREFLIRLGHLYADPSVGPEGIP
jgi:hypothetical protein